MIIEIGSHSGGEDRLEVPRHILDAYNSLRSFSAEELSVDQVGALFRGKAESSEHTLHPHLPRFHVQTKLTPWSIPHEISGLDAFGPPPQSSERGGNRIIEKLTKLIKSVPRPALPLPRPRAILHLHPR